MNQFGVVAEETDQYFITMDAPVNLRLNGGEALSLKAGESRKAALSCDSNVFLDRQLENNGSVSYAVDDPSIASVDAEGKVTGLSAGAANLTATMLPSGRSVSIPLKITGGEHFRFDDVRKESAYYFDAVYWAYESEPQITNGTSARLFSPEDTCTRGQVVTFLWRAAGCPEPESTATKFTDVKPDAYYAKAVAWAVEQGITKGASETAFSPNLGCTRAQAVTFLHRYEHTPKPCSTSNPFNDVLPTAYYYNAVLWAVENKITNGTSATAFSPDKTCTRAQIVTFLYRDMK